MKPAKVQSHKIGAHTIFADSDVISCYYKGPLTLDELVAVHLILEAALTKYQFVYQVIDLGTLPLPSAELRRWIARWAQSHQLRAVIAFNVNPPLRLIMNFLQNAVRLLKGTAPVAVFLRTEEDARAFIADDRKQSR